MKQKGHIRNVVRNVVQDMLLASVVVDNAITIIKLTRNTDIVLCSGYYDVPDVVTPVGKFTTSPGRSFFNRNNLTKIRQNGNITHVRLWVNALPDIDNLYFDIWRKDGATWDRKTHQDIRSLLTEDDPVTVALPTPAAVLEGDFIGLSGLSNNAGGQNNLGMVAFTNGSYYAAGYPGPDNYNWAGASSFNYYVPIQTFIQAPMIVGIGDSLMAGHDGNYSNIENSVTVNLTYQILSQLYAIDSKYVYQNMGIGSNTTTQMVARFTNDVVNLKPKIALIGSQTAAIIFGESKATILANLTTMLDACAANGIVPVVCKIFPWTDGTNEQMQLRDSIATDAEALVATYAGSVWVDLDSAIGEFRAGGDAGNLWDIQAIYDGDGVHLNQAGYTKVAETINAAILVKYSLA